MKAFVLYTLARLLLFGAAFGLIWLVFGRWLTWDSISALYTAIVALAISSLVALFALGGLRDDFAAHVSRRADRAKAAYDAMRAAEDDDDDEPASPLRDSSLPADPATTADAERPRAADGGPA